MGPPGSNTEELHERFEKGEGEVEPGATIKMLIPSFYFPVRHDNSADPDS